ncbi:MAG: carbon-nitrogen hydrolase family protein [Candidatus Palauibacterales bacterium]|nr:carbon-nitrogen hydrolase family protein [Candidatus Palauibacterales bacterium]
MSLVAAVVQLNSTSDEAASLERAESLVRRAAADGATLIATPENTNFLGPHEEKVRRAQSLDGPVCERFAGLARELRVHLLLGSFNERCDEPGRCYNTSVLFGPDGARLGVYRKIHLFDVDISPETRFTESATIEPGREVVVAQVGPAGLGMSICFDLRFSWLYGELRSRGAELIAVPSAFTAVTGKDHWHVLLRARAIETQSWVLAPAQAGRHDDLGLRESYGHALIVDPWGRIVADAGDDPGFVVAEIDLEKVRQVRRALPMRAPVDPLK